MDVITLERLFKKVSISLEYLVNGFDIETLLMMQQACVVLEAKTKLDEVVVTSVHVKALVLDDLRMIQKNKVSIEHAVKLKELDIETMCLN